jgi:alpha-D-xyloside xylohydrolase
VDGPGWVHETHGFDSLPLLVRPGAVVPVGASDDRPDYDYLDGVTLQVYQLADGARVSTTIPDTTGTTRCTFTTWREGDVVHVSRTGEPAPWRVLLVGSTAVTSSSAGTGSASDAGWLVDLAASTDSCAVQLTAGRAEM